ncbi:fructose-1,6-bisphosphatase class 1/Sedoheputulose-1,7-bisphosphatase [Diplogelasinospora grovesii]|uniref:Fructose-1,6-bisphosphatase class 1/Sedoheputulose-1,7-bisphosphatase n=1 Tax=Diplogelasinospora grovesii TaxID=303347 RepID=A0AAN6MZ75_9PEZI|nr:fructose-1,6-bisphosphatase class 1/Sedoheputulose-1,7-bisphosphatase [Diplogelasinospora grovesii]
MEDMSGPPSVSRDLESYLRMLLPHRASLRSVVIPVILEAISEIDVALQSSLHVTLAGTANSFGDDQLNVDVVAENIVRAALNRYPSAFRTASSEEDPVERSIISGASATEVTAEKYTVAFDPLDGSSIIKPNWSVGSIFGIWEGESALSKSPEKNQIAAVLGVYGPRTTAFVALQVPGAPVESVCFELGLPMRDQWQIIRPVVKLDEGPFKTRYFAPANLRSAADDQLYMNLVSFYIKEKYTLRYSGGLVPDVAHALTKGHGIYLSPATGASTAKLRRLYELVPVALVVECAGGKAIEPLTGKRILETPIRDCDERGALVCGTAEEVELAQRAFAPR